MNIDILTSPQSLVKFMPNDTLNSSWTPLFNADSSTTLPDWTNRSLFSDLDPLSTSLPYRKELNIFATVVTVLILFAIIVGTIIGNILVCIAVCLVKKLRRPYNYLLVSLAVSDLCVAILVMPMALLYELLGEWQYGRVICDVWVSFDVLSCTASILNLCMISVDRYFAITKPLEYGVKRTPTRMISYIVFVWISAAFVSVPPVLILGNEHGDGSICQVCQNFWYQIYATFISFYIPLSVMLTVYYKIFQAAKRIVDEERKAQAHLRSIATNGTNSSKLKSQAAPVIPNNRRYSVVEINNGEVETKLMPQLSAQNTSHQTWASNSSNCLPQSDCPPHGLLHDADYKLAKQAFQNHLEVPVNDSPYGNISPVSTTTCESSWSICQIRDDKNKAILPISHGSVIPTQLQDEQLQNDLSYRNVSQNQLITKDSSKSLISKKGFADIEIYSTNYPTIEGYQPIESVRKINEIPPRREGKTSTDMGNQSDTSSQLLLSKGLHDEERRKSSVGSPRRKYLIPPKSKLRITLAKERKASFTLGIIMSAFIICWLPFFVLALVRPFLTDQSVIPEIISSLFLWLGYANSLLNPIIYATLNKDFRKPFQEILCLRCSSLNILMREEFYHSQYGDPDTPNHSHVRTSNPKRDSWDPPLSGETRNSRSLLTISRRDTLTESRF